KLALRPPCGCAGLPFPEDCGRDRKRRSCRAGSASEIDRIGRQVADGRKIFAERRQGRQQRQQRLRGSRLNNEAAAFFAYDGILARKSELTGYPHRLIPAVPKNPDVPFRHGRISLRHMPKRMATTLGLSTPLPSKRKCEGKVRHRTAPL